MSKKIDDLEKEIGKIKDEPEQKKIDGDLAATLKAEAEARKAGKK